MGDLAFASSGSQFSETAETANTLNDQSREFWVGHSNQHLAQTQFLLYHIQPGIHFRSRFKRRCEERGVYGWFTCKPNKHQVFGVMEGRIKDIFSIRAWVEQCCIPHPFEKKTAFSTFTFCTQPEFTAFSQRLTLPLFTGKCSRPVVQVLPRKKFN